MNEGKEIRVDAIALGVRGWAFVLFLISMSWLVCGIFIGLWLGDENRDYDTVLKAHERLWGVAMEKIEEDRSRMKRYNDFLDDASQRDTYEYEKGD